MKQFNPLLKVPIWFLNSQGTIPFTFHVDGAEVYRNTEYFVWSCGSFLATGDVSRQCLGLFSCPFILCCPTFVLVSASGMQNSSVWLPCLPRYLTSNFLLWSWRTSPWRVMKILGALSGWKCGSNMCGSLTKCGLCNLGEEGCSPQGLRTLGMVVIMCCSGCVSYHRVGWRGVWPQVISLQDARTTSSSWVEAFLLFYSNFPMWNLGTVSKIVLQLLPAARGAYFAARYDAKARVETNNFLRHYGCSLICEQCLASKISKTTDDRMCYKDFRLESPRWLTRINHDTYMRTTPPRAISPWHIIPGWSLESCLHDIMHVVYLGTGRDLVASLLGDFLECGVLGPPHLSVDHRLRLFSIEMNKFFKSEKSFAQIYQTFSYFGIKYLSIFDAAFKGLDLYLWGSKDQRAKAAVHSQEHGSWNQLRIPRTWKCVESGACKSVVGLHGMQSCSVRVRNRWLSFFEVIVFCQPNEIVFGCCIPALVVSSSNMLILVSPCRNCGSFPMQIEEPIYHPY